MKKLLAIIMCMTIALSSFGFSASAQENKKNEYPIILIHGLMGWGESHGVNSIVPYWGTFSGNIPDYLRYNGYDIYTACMGGLSSAWDQTCELYAQLTGIRVDYGEAHSKEHNHERFGRSYDEPLCPSFGQKDKNGNPTKVHLYGYSLGGTVARLFASILEHGYEEELKACDNPSDFFKGGKGEYIYSVTCTAAPHQGTLVLDKENNRLVNFVANLVYIIWGGIGNSPLRSLWDIQLEHFGFTDASSDGMDGDFSLKKINEILNSRDCAYYDLTVKGAAEVAEKIKIVDSIVYLSYCSESVFTSELTGNVYPDLFMNPVMYYITAPIISGFEEGEFMGIYIDDSWLINDGIVSTETALYPEGEPHKDYEPENVGKGVWNVMPVIENMDHTDYMGLFTNPFKSYFFYMDVCKTLYSI